MIRKVLLAISAISLIASPAAAAGRTASQPAASEDLVGNPWIPWAFFLVGVVVAVIIVSDDDEPASP